MLAVKVSYSARSNLEALNFMRCGTARNSVALSAPSIVNARKDIARHSFVRPTGGKEKKHCFH